MKKFICFIMFLLTTLLFSSSLVMAQDQLRDQEQDRDQLRDQLREQDGDQLRRQVYGWDLMTAEERVQHRETMRNMKTEEEREAYRMEHHQRMQERAQQRGVTLPPYQPGRGMGGAGRGRNQ
ncbi:MAG: hypothetical protein OQK76_11850 [Gammaproteobacteria bacterium]|nr:hypothetical protein [Gammaproteobacteria bacterium]MCW8911298.1 hypothetical protein [Gammaproteobacteria bacterium]MCW9005162.1 hypothetical protein [Gammaproteobacteria bacterium]MCW9055525.1 hypothetical protein [Gammaproteobacteria bacterium]